MNEIRLVYFGDIKDISDSLLFFLNVVDVRPENERQQGFYIFETKFGQETVRSLSLDLCDNEAKDVLIFRYLSQEESKSLQNSSQQRRYFVLLHGFFNLDYVVREIKTDNLGQFSFLVDMSNSENFKPFAYVNRHITSKNFYRVAKVKPAGKKMQDSRQSWNLPLFVLVLFKILINPINEIKRLALIAKQSNLRIIARLLELVLFIDFVVRAVVVKTVQLLGLHFFYKSKFVAGAIRVVSIKSAYFFRHIFLMSIFKVFGSIVDGFNLMVRAKDFFVTAFYYKFVHKMYYNFVHTMYHGVIKRFADFILYKMIYVLYFTLVELLVHKFYFNYLVPVFNSSRLHIYILVRYKITHYLTMAYYRGYGLCYDICTASYRFGKLILLFPFFKVFWFCKFQYEKRLKRFLL